MSKNVTVDEAIARGHRMVNYPALSVMIGTIGLSFYLGLMKIFQPWIFAVGFGLAFVLPWLYWSVMITKWRLWAFENVRNVHELKKRAVQEKLIWPDGSMFEKTEIRSQNEKARWLSLQSKFDRPDLFIDDIMIPDETLIRYAAMRKYAELALMAGCVILGLYMMMTNKNAFLGVVLLLVGIYFVFDNYKKAGNRDPQIIVNIEGIATATTQFYEWSVIENEEVVIEGLGKDTRRYLIYDHPDGSERLQIDDFDISPQKLNKLLILYRGRNNRRI